MMRRSAAMFVGSATSAAFTHWHQVGWCKLKHVSNSVLACPVRFISSKSRVHLSKDRDQVGLSAGRLVGFMKCTVLIGRAGFDTMPSIPNPTVCLR